MRAFAIWLVLAILVALGGPRAAIADEKSDAYACNRTGQVDACNRSLDRVEARIRKDPNNAELYRERGVIHLRLRHFDLARDDFMRVTVVQPDSAENYINRASALMRMGYGAKARADAEQAIRLAPKNPMGYVLRGITYMGARQDDKAIADFTRAIALQPDRAATYVARSSAHINKGEYELANQDCLRAIALMPDHTDLMGTDPETAQVVRCKPAK